MEGAAQVPRACWLAGIFVQEPRALARAHDRQTPSHAVAQQTPCAQMFEAHCPADPQALPGGLRPQVPPWQLAGVRQSASDAQVVLQAALSPQRKGEQDCWAAITHFPAPSHSAAVVSDDAEQVASRQTAPAG